MNESQANFDLDDLDGFMDKTFGVRLPKRIEPMLDEMRAKGIKVGPKLRPHIAELIESLYQRIQERANPISKDPTV